jgi:hypothetical protein
MKAQITRKALIIILAVGTLIAACSPDKIITGGPTQLEKQAVTWVNSTCPKSDGVHCDLHVNP